MRAECKNTNNESSIPTRERIYIQDLLLNEEERMHIHVIHDGHEAKYWLEPQVELAENNGIAEERLTKIKKIVERNADRFKEQFKEHIGKRIND